jgi:hypothetical protein
MSLRQTLTRLRAAVEPLPPTAVAVGVNVAGHLAELSTPDLERLEKLLDRIVGWTRRPSGWCS